MSETVPDDRDASSLAPTRPPEPPIHGAARTGDLTLLARLVAEGADVDQRAHVEDDDGTWLAGLTPLMTAARSIDGATAGTLRWLVEHGADVHARCEEGHTAAWHAAGHGGREASDRTAVTPDHAERLAYLLGLGLDPHEGDADGRSLLTEACAAGDPARVRLLLEAGVPATLAVATPARPPFTTFIAVLLRPLWRLVGLGRRDVPRGSASASTIPVFCAARSGSAECVSLLLERGADPNERDDSGRTPLMAAGSADVVRTLLAAGAARDAVDEYGHDALDRALESDDDDADTDTTERLATVRALIDAGADIERADASGTTRLASAAFSRDAGAVARLLELGARPDARERFRTTPLHSICWQGESGDDEENAACERIIRALVAAGADVAARDRRGGTPLHEAASGDWGNATAIRTLLALGAEPDPTDSGGVTPLALAAGSAELACVELLLAAGADPRHADKGGDTPLDAARAELATWEEMVADGPIEEIARGEQASHAEINREMDELLAGEAEERRGPGLETDLPRLMESQAQRHRDEREQARRTVEVLKRAVGERG